jgi:hypothetical protein
MITNYEINNAKTTVELDELVEKAGFERNCEPDNSMTYKEHAEFFAEEAPKAGNGQEHMEELVEILETAETKWHELEA